MLAVVIVAGLVAAVGFVVIAAGGVIPVLGDPMAAWREPASSLVLPALLLLVSTGLLVVGGLGRVRRRGASGRRQAVVIGAVAIWLAVGVGGLVVLGRDLVLPGTARVEGLPGQAEPWSGPMVCRRYRWGSFESTGRSAEVQVPASATGGEVTFALVLAGVDGDNPSLIAGDARWGWSTGSSMSMASADISDDGLRGTILTLPTPILHRDAAPSMVSLTWDCLG